MPALSMTFLKSQQPNHDTIEDLIYKYTRNDGLGITALTEHHRHLFEQYINEHNQYNNHLHKTKSIPTDQLSRYDILMILEDVEKTHKAIQKKMENALWPKDPDDNWD